MTSLGSSALAQRTNSVVENTMLQDVLSVLLIVVPALFVAVVNHAISYDDAFITYRYAYNFASGQGFVYNPGEWFMGTTAPFYGLLLGMLGWLFGPDAIPTISGVLSGGSLLLAGLALYVYGRLHGHALVGLLAGLFFVCNPLLPLTFGGEMLFQAALILWAFVLYRRDRTNAAALLLALAVLTRIDSVIALGVVGLHFLVTRRRLPWRAGAVALLLAGYQRLAGPRVAWARLALGALVGLALLPGLAAQLNQTRGYAERSPNPTERLYEQAGAWLRASSAPDASVGYFEIGRLGYAAQRRIVDPLGLLDPAVPPHVATGDLLWAYEHNQPEYILYNEAFAGWFAPMLEAPWFAQKYRPVAAFARPDYRIRIVMYKRVNP